ncbi:N-(2-amino-2-carboxyethyl)-L-glutamate synthase [Streptomyces sp. enrichment culture]|uniref:2,3-diaminopropionate biosynthesis protein SbnA n=1 Tax=Streptomyces sp. enrichment culture TaxID=1795815 RepID=UPI003F57143A
MTEIFHGAPGRRTARTSTGFRLITSPSEYIPDDVYLDLSQVLGRRVHMKCEGLNFAGSVKIKAATEMVDAAERSGLLRPGGRMVESSSGSLGVALAMIAAGRGYAFTCVTDTRCNERNLRLMRVYGADVVVIEAPDPVEGLLGARLRHVADLCAREPDVLWLNQYANDSNWLAHYKTTGPSIATAYPDAEMVFIGAGTTGTLTGCARYLKQVGHPAKIVAVDSLGSVTFGGPSGPRHIPGLGTGRRPEIVDESVIDDIVMVPELETIRMCRTMAGRGYLFGGSTGTVLAGMMHRISAERADMPVVAISPDFGERYLDSIYDDDWVRDRFDPGGGAGRITRRRPAAPAADGLGGI